MKKRLTAILTVMALMLTGCAGNVTSGTESQPASDAQSGISDNESSDTSSRYEIITATEMAEKMGLGISLGNCLLYTSPSPRDRTRSRMPSSA